MDDTLGPLSGPSALSMCYTDARYSQMNVLETMSGLEHLPEVREAHLKSYVGSFFGQFGEVKQQELQIMRRPRERGWRIWGVSPTLCNLRLIIVPHGPLFTQSANIW